MLCYRYMGVLHQYIPGTFYQYVEGLFISTMKWPVPRYPYSVPITRHVRINFVLNPYCIYNKTLVLFRVPQKSRYIFQGLVLITDTLCTRITRNKKERKTGVCRHCLYIRSYNSLHLLSININFRDVIICFWRSIYWKNLHSMRKSVLIEKKSKICFKL